MSNTAIAIIGANYGDEGKGLATDFFARKLDAIMVSRCNGGSQAGHTVQTEDKRHVFGHVGSGAFAGAATYLSEAFILNPMMLRKELGELKKRQIIYASPKCRVTTPYDMAINSLIELKRGAGRHGSCGMGINETVTRDAAGFHLTAEQIKPGVSYAPMLRNDYLLERIENIRDRWVPMRMLELGLSRDDFNASGQLYFDMLKMSAEKVMEELLYNSEYFHLNDPKDFIKDGRIIIEGAQGLMLDEFLGDFPHVTRSVTGLASSVRAAYECGKTKIQPIYMSRSYLTRHGAGELLYEGLKITDKELETDHTNVQNPWQGEIRYAPLNLHEMAWFIREDTKRAAYVAQLFGVEIKPAKLFITCMDQLGENVNIVSRNKEIIKMKSIKLISYIEKVMSMEVYATSHGPTANDVQIRQPVL